MIILQSSTPLDHGLHTCMPVVSSRSFVKEEVSLFNVSLPLIVVMGKAHKHMKISAMLLTSGKLFIICIARQRSVIMTLLYNVFNDEHLVITA